MQITLPSSTQQNLLVYRADKFSYAQNSITFPPYGHPIFQMALDIDPFNCGTAGS